MSPFGLVLAGGKSLRMARDKSLMTLGHCNLAERACRTLHQAGISKIFLSVRSEQAVHFEYLKRDQIGLLVDSVEDQGPISALLSAHAFDLRADWFVLACDYPEAESGDVQDILKASKEFSEKQIVCFQNELKIDEPLFALWKGSALEILEKNFRLGISGPSYSLKSIPHLSLKPKKYNSLINLNSPADFLLLSATD